MVEELLSHFIVAHLLVTFRVVEGRDLFEHRDETRSFLSALLASSSCHCRVAANFPNEAIASRARAHGGFGD